MVYDGGYSEQGRPYAGPAAARPGPPRQQYPPQNSQAPQQYNNAPPPQEYDQYQQDDYNYNDDGYGGAYDQGYEQPYEDMTYGRAPPPNQNYPPPQQDYYGSGPGRGGPPPGRGRGRPMGRPPPPDGRGQYPPRAGPPGHAPGPGRGGYPPPGRGGRPINERHGASDPTGTRRPRIDHTSPGDGGFGGSAFPAFPGMQRRTDMDEEQQITGQMAGIDLNGGQRPAPRGRGGMGPPPPRGPPPPGDGYGGRPPMNGPRRAAPRPYPPQQQGGYPEQRRGPPSGQGYGPTNGYQEENFGPPARSMTMPVREPAGMGMRDPGFPPRNESVRQNGPPHGQAMMPPRPSTAQAMRQPPRDMYVPNGGPQMVYDEPAYDVGQDAGYGGPQQRPASLDDFYGSYYNDDAANGSSDYGAPPPPPHQSSVEAGIPQQFDNVPPRQSYDSQMRPAPAHGQLEGGPQRGAARIPEVSRTKSQPDLRQSQTAIFEMAGDMPPIPTQYQQHQQHQQSAPSQHSFNDSQHSGYEQNGNGPARGGPGLPSNPTMGHQNGHYGRSASFDQPGPPPSQGLPDHPPQAYRPGPQPNGHLGGPVKPAHSADSLPSHPVPVRVGLAPKPPPVRNYNGGITASTAPPPLAAPATAPLSMQSQAPPPQQAPGGGQPPQTKVVEPPVTVSELERLKTIIKSNPQDQVSALSLAKKLVEAVDVLVPLQPDPKSRTRSKDRYLSDAHKILKKLNSADNVDAMFFLADCLGRGLFSQGDPDNKEAFMLYQSAAKKGHAQAAYRTAVCCEIGNEEGGGTRRDPLKAIQWYRRAAILNDTPAMYKVGMILLKGLLGQPRDPREAISWLKRAAERADAENPHALHELGLLYETAEDNGPIVRDPAYAFSLFKQAADLGYKFSQFRLGAAYEYGLMGVPVDARLSIMWYSRAATQAEHQSELALSGWYLTGSEGVLQQSDTEAYLWARKAAQAGLAKAEFAMGYYTESGIGVPENLEDAKRWYWRAAAQDYPDARKRLEELKRMGKNVPRQRERISRSKMGKQQEGECLVM